MEYYINLKRNKTNTAGAKAPDDINEICRQLGMKSFEVPAFPQGKHKIYQKLWLLTAASSWWLKLERTVCQDDVIIYQHPMYGTRIAEKMIPRIRRKKKCKFIAVIHDLESLRRGIKGVVTDNFKTNMIADNNLLKKFNKVICHNESMKAYLAEQGFEKSMLICLGIFDYLSDCERVQPEKGDVPSVAIVGNLAKEKCGYIYKIAKIGTSGSNENLRVHLYGNHYDKAAGNSNVVYHGSFRPEEVGDHLEGDFGLVWDGSAAETCAGNTGQYLKYNNPHKTSMYLSASMPVIVWSRAAIAKFVSENKVGIVVDSLYELEEKIENISSEEYKEMCNNAADLSKKLRTGYYFKKALGTAGQE